MGNYKFLLFVLLLNCWAFSGSTQNIQKMPPKIVPGAMTSVLRSEIEKNTEISDALTSLTEDGDYIKIGEGQVSRLEEDSVSVEVYFTILTKVKNRMTEYKYLVYSKGRDGKAIAFFDGKKRVPKNNPKGSTERLFGCGAWSAWQPDGTSCDPNFLCISHSQTALYQHYYKTRQCRNGIQKITKKDKVHCGC